MLRFSIPLLLFLPLFVQAETFLSLQVEDLVFEKGEAIPEIFDVRRSYSRELSKWVTPATPYLRTKDAKETFLHITRERNNSNRLPTSALRICLGNPKQTVKGSLFIQDGKKGMQEYPFTFNLEKSKKLPADRKGEINYLNNKKAYYDWLQELRIPGNAWFRHQANQTSLRLNELQPEKKHLKENNRANRFIPPARKVGLENTLDLFSGGRAISENLQLDRELRLSADEQNRTITLSSVKGITIEEMPWKELIGDAKPKLDPLANFSGND